MWKPRDGLAKLASRRATEPQFARAIANQANKRGVGGKYSPQGMVGQTCVATLNGVVKDGETTQPRSLEKQKTEKKHRTKNHLLRFCGFSFLSSVFFSGFLGRFFHTKGGVCFSRSVVVLLLFCLKKLASLVQFGGGAGGVGGYSKKQDVFLYHCCWFFYHCRWSFYYIRVIREDDPFCLTW